MMVTGRACGLNSLLSSNKASLLTSGKLHDPVQELIMVYKWKQRLYIVYNISEKHDCQGKSICFCNLCNT